MICRATSLTRAVVAIALLLVKVTVSTPPVLVKVAKVLLLNCRLLPLTVNSASAVLKPKISLATAVPGRFRVRLAPAQSPLPPLRASNSASASTALAPSSSITTLPTPAQATLPSLTLTMLGAALAGEVVKLRKSMLEGSP
ncbi:hypothetical protein D9M68_339880 [compost metagenome]